MEVLGHREGVLQLGGNETRSRHDRTIHYTEPPGF